MQQMNLILNIYSVSSFKGKIEPYLEGKKNVNSDLKFSKGQELLLLL